MASSDALVDAPSAGPLRALRLTSANYRRLIVRPASALIGLAGLVWMVQRLS